MVNYVATKPQIQVIDQSEPTPEEMFKHVCQCMGWEPDMVRLMGRPDFREFVKCVPQYQSCLPAMEQINSCNNTIGNLGEFLRRCEHFVVNSCCPEQQLYGDVTRHIYSSRNIVYVDQIVTGLGGDFVDNYPVPPGKYLLLQTEQRPGFVPEVVEAHFTLANNGTNFLNIGVQFQVLSEKIGSELLGSTFLDEDGRTKKVPFPSWRGRRGLRIGSQERVQVLLRVTGPNNLDHAAIAIHLDVEGWAKLCLPPERGVCS